MDLNTSALEQIRWLKEGKITSEQLLELYREKYEAENPAINAVINTDFESIKILTAQILNK